MSSTNDTRTSPQVIGRYALCGQIASGGMASVHFGRLMGPAGFSRTVAIKRLHQQYASDPAFVEMFLDEARIAARIRHPNAVHTLDVVATEGELFLVMEYVPGETLSRLMRQLQAPIAPRLAVTLAHGLLQGLHAVHEAKSERGEQLNIVHRDVSPQNVLVGTDGITRILDFGVAKAAGRLQLTRDGQVKGKIPYMAPEQLLSEPVSRRTDLYAVGLVLWEMLTGQRVFVGDNDGALVHNVLKGPTLTPTEHLRLHPELVLDPGTLRQIGLLEPVLQKALAMNPADRFTTAREMALTLERTLAPVSSTEVGEWVERIAGAALDTRAQHISEIESKTSGVHALDVLQETQVADLGRPVPQPAPPAPSSTPAPKPPTPAQAGSEQSFVRSLRTPLRTAVGVTLVLAAVAAVVFFSLTPEVTPTPAPQPPKLALPEPPAPLPAPAAIPMEPLMAVEKEPALSPPVRPRAPHRAKGKPVEPGAATPERKPADDDCDPPFTFDADGTKHIKPHCI